MLLLSEICCHSCYVQGQPTTHISQKHPLCYSLPALPAWKQGENAGERLKIFIWIKLSCTQWLWVLSNTAWKEVQFSSLLSSGLVVERFLHRAERQEQEIQVPAAAVCTNLGKLAAVPIIWGFSDFEKSSLHLPKSWVVKPEELLLV